MEDGKDRVYLDPKSGIESDGWWTCHKDIKKGDLIFLWLANVPYPLSEKKRNSVPFAYLSAPSSSCALSTRLCLWASRSSPAAMLCAVLKGMPINL